MITEQQATAQNANANVDVAAVALWEALEALIAQCESDILFVKGPALADGRAVLGQTQRAIGEAKQRLKLMRRVE